MWLNGDADFRPGAELYRSDRTFHLLGYAATHSQLLLSSTRGSDNEPCETTVEILFKPVEAVHLQACYPGLVIRCATEIEAQRINSGVSDYGYRAPDARVLVLETRGAAGYVVCPAVGWREDVLPRMQPSLFNPVSTYEPVWPTGPVFGVDGGVNIASPAETVQAFLAEPGKGTRRDRYRYAYVLSAKSPEQGRRTVGVFVSEADASEAADLLGPAFSNPRVEEVPIVL